MKYKLIAIIIAVVFLLGLIGSAAELTSPPHDTVRIVSDGEVIRTLDLSTAPDMTFEVRCNGGSNTVEIKDHTIMVSSADCPDKTCVNMGRLSSSAMPIVCLPHHLVIEFTDDDISYINGTSVDDTRVDAITR